jgi:hypothetical protein
MGKIKGQFQPLLGQSVLGSAIASLARVALTNPGSPPAPMMDTLLFTLEDGRNFELLIGQSNVQFEEIQTANLFAGFELEPDDQLVIYPIHSIAILPQTVESLTEIWAGEDNSQFLVAVSLWGKNHKHIISVCTEGDEAELMSLEALRQRMDEMVFSYGFLSHQLYPSARSSPDVAVLRSA